MLSGIEQVTLLSDGTRERLQLSSAVMGPAEIADNLGLCVLVLFSLLDMLVDKHVSGIEGENFKARYEALRVGNDYRIIFKETYRIMRLLRNAVVHCRSGVFRDSEKIDVEYDTNHGTRCRLKITPHACLLVFSLIVHYAQVSESSYMVGIIRSYYDDIRTGVNDLSDDICGPLLNMRGGIRLKTARYRVTNPTCEMSARSDTLRISEIKLSDAERELFGIDYIVSVGGEEYLVLVKHWTATGRSPVPTWTNGSSIKRSSSIDSYPSNPYSHLARIFPANALCQCSRGHACADHGPSVDRESSREYALSLPCSDGELCASV